MSNNERDQEEVEADRFALELLTGKPDASITTGARWPNAQSLAELAEEFGRRNQIDPGHVVLNYAHSMGKEFFAVGQNALKILYPNANAIQIVRNELAGHLNWERLPEDSSQYLMRITRQESDE